MAQGTAASLVPRVEAESGTKHLQPGARAKAGLGTCLALLGSVSWIRLKDSALQRCSGVQLQRELCCLGLSPDSHPIHLRLPISAEFEAE